ncbi:uncharacterized protein [Penaeus vannamei]|uniref:uncharacterized protein isoform X2 n=1 Tax=Penaeus vannamei TaxID=6689 RepID=UPI00387F87DC
MQRSFAFAGDTTKIMRLGVIEHYLYDIRPSASSSGGAARAVSRPDPERAVRRRDRQRCEMRPGSKLRICFALGLLTLSLTQECEILRIRGFKIPLDVGPRSVSVLLEENMKIWITFLQVGGLSSKAKQWHNIATLKKGSAFCVDAPTLLGDETCSHQKRELILRTSDTTSWKLDCPGVVQAPEGPPQCRHHQLHAAYLGVDSVPASFYWRPNALATGLSATGKDYATQAWAKDSGTWKDVNFGSDPGGRPCRVYSKRLNLSSPCSQTLTSEDYITFKSIDKDVVTRTSYFALNCSGIPDETVAGTPTEDSWPVSAIVGTAVLVVIVVGVVVFAVVLVVKLRKSRSSRKTAIPADDLHDPRRDADRKDEHDYCYID